MIEIQKLATLALQLTLSGQNLNLVLAAIWKKNPNLESSQKSAIQDIAFGSLRFYGMLNAILQKLLLKQINDDALHALLIIALYQLQYTRAKPFAIVDHAVSTVKEIGQPAAKGLVNAILRNYLRQKENLLKDVSTNNEAVLNHPEWWIKKIQLEYPENWMSILQTSNLPPPMTLRINKKNCSVEKYLELLESHQIEARHLNRDAIVLSRPMPVYKLPGFAEGLVSIQDQSAQYAALLLDLSPGMRVLDACSAPGGKTGHMLENADIELTAIDSDATRLKKVDDNLKRLKLAAHLIEGDAGDPGKWWDGQSFDRILIDAPCSGSGVTRRHPDIKWMRRVTDIAQFAAQQERLLKALWPVLKVGGKLLYATCSVFREENNDQVVAHLSHFKDARFFPINELPIVNGQIVPDEFHDGFFYALLAKV